MIKVFLRQFKQIFHDICAERKARKIASDSKYEEDRRLAFFLRNVHSIEKGLSLETPRMGFGVEKINELIDNLLEYKEKGFDLNRAHILMAVDAIEEYITFHKNNNYSDENIIRIEERFASFRKLIPEHNGKLGGTTLIKRDRFSDEQIASVKCFLENRHSVRQFSGECVPVEDIIAAVDLANRAPSACNRQASRVYIIPKEKKSLISDWVEGVGGFQNDVDTFIMVTGKRSFYYQNEHFQYIVSASILAGYLAMTLELFHIGSCILQRPVVYSRKWNALQDKLHIPKDEQIVAFLGCGMLKEEYVVPISNRLPFDEIGTIIK